MKKLIMMYLITSITTIAKTQVNLVPNFSFEQFDTCPDGQDQIERSIGWHKFSSIFSTPDYYNACAPSGDFNVPNSFAGYQPDLRNCSAYAGVVTFGSATNDREYIGIKLDSSLTIGQKYFVSFYCVMAELVYPNGYHLGMPSNNIGARFSTVPYSVTNPAPINNFAHVYSSAVITDSINWTRVGGSLIADSNYNYIAIGNFFDDINTDTLHFTCDSCLNHLSYFFVDDVCVSTDSLLCDGGINNTPCNVGINVPSSYLEVSVFPNPMTDEMRINFPINVEAEIMLMDLLGNIISKVKIYGKKQYNQDISSNLPGCYLLRIRNINSGNWIVKKIIKI